MGNNIITNPTFLAVISGVAVYIFSQIILEFFINPRKEYKKIMQKILYIINLYCCYYHNPYDLLKPKRNVRSKEEYDYASKEVRKMGAELASYIGAIPRIRFNKIKRLNIVLNSLIGISNGFYNISEHFDTSIENKKCEEIIKKELNFSEYSGGIMNKIKIWFKSAKEPFIMTILNFILVMLMIYGEFKSERDFSYITIILFSIPFVICLVITILTNIFIKIRIIKVISNFVSALLVFLIPVYYFVFSLYMLQLEDSNKNNIDLKSITYEGIVFSVQIGKKECIPVKLIVYDNGQYRLYTHYKTEDQVGLTDLKLQYTKSINGKYDYDIIKILENSINADNKTYSMDDLPEYEIYTGTGIMYVVESGQKNNPLDKFLEQINVDINKCANLEYH